NTGGLPSFPSAAVHVVTNGSRVRLSVHRSETGCTRRGSGRSVRCRVSEYDSTSHPGPSEARRDAVRIWLPRRGGYVADIVTATRRWVLTSTSSEGGANRSSHGSNRRTGRLSLPSRIRSSPGRARA